MQRNNSFLLLLCCILDVYLSFLFVCTESLTNLFPIRHHVSSYVGCFFRHLNIYKYTHQGNMLLQRI